MTDSASAVNAASAGAVWDEGSFRDRNNKVFTAQSAVYRGVSPDALANWQALAREPFFEELAGEGRIIPTSLLGERGLARDLPSGWADYLVHDRIPFVSYPYEWSFGMLKDAALLQLELIERAIPEGWTLKDASAYNIQWRGAQPVFIDIPSFEPYVEGKPWVGYRQFCMMYLYPLMLAAYRGIDFIPLLRSNLEGIEPRLADRILTGFSRFRKGVFSHVYLHARMESRYSHAELDEAKSLRQRSGTS